MTAGLIIIALAIACEIFTTLHHSSNDTTLEVITKYLGTGSCILALLSAGVYIATGFKKTSAKYFNLFLSLYVLEQLIVIVRQIVKDRSLIIIVIAIIIYGLLNVLLFAKDLGKTKSISIAWTALALSFIYDVSYIFAMKIGFSIRLLIRLLNAFSSITLPAVLLTIILFKYYDKSLRNAK